MYRYDSIEEIVDMAMKIERQKKGSPPTSTLTTHGDLNGLREVKRRILKVLIPNGRIQLQKVKRLSKLNSKATKFARRGAFEYACQEEALEQCETYFTHRNLIMSFLVPSGLPPLRGIEHQIDFIPGSTIPNRSAYRSNPMETKELQRQVNKLIEKGLVRESMSPCAVPLLLMPKKDGTLRMCVDCRVVNKITVKHRHPIPRLDDMLDELHGATYLTKIDLMSGYHQGCNLGDEWKNLL
ncbi:uncharacterized protein LOC105634651 [Jatropha curcas]|uniref:uncharacterized protein LOC105634651 n=1 Tax=Jatropha curcas TaxID=180498 RepID=UPI001895B733|nr:uncharacterized protein LOC105634651 [Jatropha curcas]